MNKSLLEEIVNRFNKEINDNSNNVELEIKFKNIDRNVFLIIYDYYLNNTNSENIQIYQYVRSLMTQKNGINSLQNTNIREKEFKNGVSISDKYISKIPIIIPYQYISSFGISYKVTLSLEVENINPFISDENSIIRIINRITFITNDNIWKIDMSIIRQINGNNISSLKNIVNHMFKEHKVDKNNFLQIFNEEKMNQNIYKYEIEVEYISKEKVKIQDLQNITHNILYIINPNYMSESNLQIQIYNLAKHVINSSNLLQQYQSAYGLKKLLPKVQMLTRYDYRNIYPMTDFYITDKANGTRCIIMIENLNGYILSEELTVFNFDDKVNTTIADGEYVDGIVYIFDIIVAKDKNISNLPFYERLLYMNEIISYLKSLNLPVEEKPYLRVDNNLEMVIKQMYNRKRNYTIDGLIFVNPVNNYLQTKTYKWKDIKDNTIDFLVKRAPSSVLGKQPYLKIDNYVLYFLFVGINKNMMNSLGLHFCTGYENIFNNNMSLDSANYFPIQFSPSNAPLAYIYYHPDDNIQDVENNIVEFKCIDNCDASDGPFIKWVPIKIRTDKKRDLDSKTYFGNDYKIAEITWINYLDPFPLNNLWEDITEDYFNSNKSGIYHSQTSVISFLKTERIMTYSHSNWILDIGSGKGQDLGRYFNAKIKHLIVVDMDRPSLSELIRRKYNFSQDVRSKHSTNVSVILMDMTSNYEILYEKIKNISNVRNNILDVIICNLSVHYFIYTKELLYNFISLLKLLLKPGGHLVITCFFGEKIFSLLSDLNEGQCWSKYENEVLKYSIKKLFSSNKLENNSQKIGVILPFSNGKYYEEYLINTNYLKEELEKNNFKQIIKRSVKDILQDFKFKNLSVSNNLTKDDISYLSLYGEIIFQKKK